MAPQEDELGRMWLERRPDALAEANRRYRKRLEAVAYRIVRDQGDAEEAVQRVFLALPNTNFEGRASLWSYLRRAAVNTAVNILRSRRRRQNVEEKLRAHALTDVHPESQTGDPEAKVLEGEMMAAIAQALLRVKAQHRQALVLRIVWGLSNTEIAEREGVPLATVGTWLRRGREELQRELRPLLAEFQRGS